MNEPTLPELPEPAYRLPLANAAQWQNALLAAEREPLSTVILEAKTVLAVHDAVERAVLAERERCAAQVLHKAELLMLPSDTWAKKYLTELAASIREGV